MQALGEIDRRLSNLLRYGTIASLDEANALVTVDLGDCVTAPLPWFAPRAGGDREWHAPEVGEQVMVLSPSGELAHGVVLPAIFQDAHPANGNSKDVHRVTYSDGTVEEYNRSTHAYLLNLPASGTITLQVGATSLVMTNAGTTLTTPAFEHSGTSATFDGTALVKQLLSFNNGIAGSKGSASSGAAISGGLNVTGGDVNADGYGLKTHHHTAQGATAPTTAAQP